MAAVENVNAQAEREPYQEPEPRDYSQPGHQSPAQNNRDEREPGDKRNAEGTLAVRLPAPQQDHTQRDQNKSKQRSDIGKVGSITDVYHSSGYPDRETGNPRGPVWRLELGMNRGEQLGQQAVARHGVPDACLAILEDQQRRDHAHEGADHDHGAEEWVSA